MPVDEGSTFTRTQRLRSSRDYSRVWRQGRRFQTRHLTIIAATGGVAEPPGARLGVTVSRKVGNAVNRNRLKRWIREYFRLGRSRFVAAMDVSVIVKPGAANLAHDDFLREIQEGFRHLRLCLDA